MDRITAKGPDLGDAEGMAEAAKEVVAATPDLAAFLVENHGVDFTSGVMCGLAITLYLLKEVQSGNIA